MFHVNVVLDYVKTDLWKHHSKCRKSQSDREPDSKRGKPVINGKLLLPSKAGAEVNETILVKMRDDEIKAVITNDSTLLEFANRMYEQNGHMQHRHQYIAQRLRELSRLLVVMKDNCATIDTIEKCLAPSNWEALLSAVKVVAEFDIKTSQYGIPSLPLRLGQSLVKCAKLLKTKSIVMNNDDMLKKMERFLELYESDWTARSASKCHNTLHVAKFNKPQLLPLTKDAQMLHKYLKEESDKLRKNCQVEDYRRFAEICLAQIILFNRKRSGEAERMKLEDFQSCVIDTEVDEDILSSLTPLEKEIIKSHKRVEILGKRGSKVPVILTDDMIRNLKFLMKIRQEMSITSNFLFGKPNSQFPIRGSDALRNFAHECGASNPSLLTSTKLRKQLATLSQVLGLNEHGQDALAKFMGHDIRVHRSFYELPENTIQLARISKVLHAVNEGKAQEADGVHSLDEIDVTEEGMI
jgi:integrase